MKKSCERCGGRLKQGKRFCSYACMRVPIKQRFMSKVKITKTCWLWIGKSRTEFGYGRFSFNRQPERAHRVSYILFTGKIPVGKHILHTCDIPECVNPKHLYVGTDKENARDRSQRGKISIGEKNPLSKYPNAFVSALRQTFKPGMVVTEAVAKNAGISRRQMKDIIEFKTRRMG